MIVMSKSKLGFTSRSTARVILGQNHSKRLIDLMLVKYMYNLCLCKFLFQSKEIYVSTLKTNARTLSECIHPPRHVMISKWEIPDFFFLYSDPDLFQNLMGSKLDQGPSSNFLRKLQPVVFV